MLVCCMLIIIHVVGLQLSVSLTLAVDSARTAVGRSTTQARQSGTRCLMNLGILTVLMALNGYENNSL